MYSAVFFISIIISAYMILLFFRLSILMDIEDTLMGLYILLTSIFFVFALYFYYPFELTIPNIFTVTASIFGIFITFYFLHRLKK